MGNVRGSFLKFKLAVASWSVQTNALAQHRKGSQVLSTQLTFFMANKHTTLRLLLEWTQGRRRRRRISREENILTASTFMLLWMPGTITFNEMSPFAIFSWGPISRNVFFHFFNIAFSVRRLTGQSVGRSIGRLKGACSCHWKTRCCC